MHLYMHVYFSSDVYIWSIMIAKAIVTKKMLYVVEFA